VTVAIARLDTLRDPLLLTGLVVPATSGDWTIYAPEAGLLAQVTKTVGAPVAAGELLVRFDVLSISQQIETNRMLLAQAERRRDDAFTERDRLQSLFDRGLVARNEVTNHRIEVTAAEGAVAQAEAELKVASLQEEATRVTARFDGIVAALWKAEGDFVTGTRDDPVMRVVDPTRTQVAVHVPVDQSARLSAGQIVTVSTTGGINAVGEVVAPEGPLPGSVVRVSMPTDPAEPRAEVRLDYQREEPLALETAVRVEILLEQRADAIVVPVEAVRRDEGGGFVFIAGEDLVAHRRDVRVGLVVGPLAQIIQGVSAGDRVIVGGGETVQDGQAIRVGR
jgi:RND family efflux transporter MFP subunit